MGLHLSWTSGGSATVLQSDGELVVLRSSRAAPPGSPLRASIALPSASTVRIKVHACKKTDEGTFLIRGRWLDLTREVRDEILMAMHEGEPES